MLATLLLVILILIVIGGLPVWPYSRSWSYGYYPSGIGSILLIVLVVLLLTGRV